MNLNSKFIIFLGLPGSGKGTQSKILTTNYDNFFSLSTGEAIRKILNKKSDSEFAKKVSDTVEKGFLIDDRMMMEIVEGEIYNWSTNLVSPREDITNHFIFDGFPRNVTQCEMLDDFFEKNKEMGDVNLLIVFDIKKRIAIKRLLDRMICSWCGNIDSTFGLKKDQIDQKKCSKCGGALSRRKDDTILTIRRRIKNDKKMIDFLIKFYQNKDIKCIKLNAALKINVLHKKIKSVIDLL